ncbi:MAG TPA: ATPase, partial [Ruminococcaceae bacterium]|nr:ATPase [Oscillospiraceae bacterium]
RAIVADRNQIISDAKREAESVVRISEERAKTLVKQDEIVKQAQAKANDLISQSQVKFREMRRASNDYIDDLMKRTEDALAANLAELRKTRSNIKASQRNSQQP